MRREDGGQAFPHVVEWSPVDGKSKVTDGGMTLRDYFAAKAMQAAMTNHQAWDAGTEGRTARVAYVIADAMLKARTE